jgi:hypothetical protein
MGSLGISSSSHEAKTAGKNIQAIWAHASVLGQSEALQLSGERICES